MISGAKLLLTLILPLGVVAFYTGCDECICETYSAEYAVTIVDDAGDPVVGLEHSVRIVRTGQTLPALFWEERYSLISDQERHLINPYGERLRFTATDGQTMVTADYVVDVPGRCHCHVNNVSGPDTLVSD